VTQVALAGSSTVLGAYGSNSAKPVIKVDSAVVKSNHTTSSATQPSTVAKLPFTGSDLVFITVAGIGLLGLGIGLRRLGRNKS
jgi:hypothetical protein